MEERKDYYGMLGVDRNASTAAIKRAYRRLAKRYHPDMGPGSSAQEFEALQAAYETLADAERRRRYDDELQRAEGAAREDRFEPLSWSFVRSPAVGDLRRPFRPGSVSGEILLSADEASSGGVLPLDVPLRAACPVCEGTGGFVFDCDRCGGDGQVERRLPVALRIPPGVRDGEVFQVRIDEPAAVSILLTVHIRPF